MNERFRVDLLYDYCGGWNYWIGCYLREITMTPSEKKARESLLSDASYLLKSVDHQYSCACETCRQSQVERVASALSEAERRGFERAKELMLEELKTRDFIGPLTVRNLKYEEA